MEVGADALPPPELSGERLARRDRLERKHGDLTCARSHEPQPLDGEALNTIWGPEGGGDGLEALMLGFERGDVLGQLQNLVADVSGIGNRCNVCDGREHGECCNGESHEYRGALPP